MKIPLIVILGPTASGKTNLAINIAQKFRGEIICADSRTVYEGLDLGTAKPTKEEQEKIPHHLLDIIEPGKAFSVAKFKKLAEQKIAKIWQKGKIPFLVGGSPLYIDAIIYGYQIPAVPPDPKLRQSLEKKSNQALFGMLAKGDPEFAKVVDKNNKRRLIRALEIIEKTHQKFSDLRKKKKTKYDLLILGIDLPRKKLFQKIDTRVDSRIESGMIEEVRKLTKKVDPVWLESLGLEYRFLSRYVLGRLAKKEAISQLKFAIHGFARRQLTWFRKNKEVHWIKNQKQAEKLIRSFLSK